MAKKDGLNVLPKLHKKVLVWAGMEWCISRLVYEKTWRSEIEDIEFPVTRENGRWWVHLPEDPTPEKVEEDNALL